MLEEESVQVPFHYNDEDGNVIFRDALTFTPTEYRNTSKAERETMMQQRYDDWVTYVNTPHEDSPPEEP